MKGNLSGRPWALRVLDALRLCLRVWREDRRETASREARPDEVPLSAAQYSRR